MSRTLVVFGIFGALFCSQAVVCPPASAEELHEEFLEGLRQRGYYDYALYYLDKLEERTDLPGEFKSVLPYQRAITLLEGASTINSPELRDEQLDRAVAQLEAFTRANPDHPLAANANTQLARILIEKARVKIWESESPANKDNNEKFRLEGRDLLTKAREIFQKAHDQHKAAYDQFPKFIPQEDKERYEARSKAEIAYMRAQIDLALCTYEEAQTFPRGSQEFKNLLTKAAEEFKDIHEKYRSMVGGLYSRMWQGKCFEEQEDIGKALGIYNELLAHPGKSQAMQNVKNQVLQFRLICLNHEQRKDYQLVINEAEKWIGENRKLAGFNVGLGIRFQKAIAHEKLAEKIETEFNTNRTEPKPPAKPTAEIEGHLRKAIQDAQEVTRYAGQYKAPSQFMISRIKGKLGLDEGDPKTIEEALVKADKMRQDIEVWENRIKAAQTKQEKTNLEESLRAHLNDTARIATLALELANEDTAALQLNKARFLLCYIYYKIERNYESAVIGEFLARHFARDEEKELSDLAQNGATVARAAWYQEYEAKSREQASLPTEDQDVRFELDQMVRVCELTTELWPQSGLADESRMTLGRIYSRLEQPVEAAKWFSAVSSTELKGIAKVSGGQAYWNAYLGGTDQQQEDKRPKPEELAQWQANAKKFLEEGLGLLNKEIPENATVEAATDLILARVTLAQITVYEQNYDEAIKYLTDTKDFHHSPLAAVKVADDEKRPEKGVKSQRFASLVYQVLLRAYVGKQQTNEALKAMDDLENLVGKDNATDLSNTYRELGEQIAKEVKRLQAEGPKERLDKILASFNTFLNALYEPERRKTMSDGSLQWMAETFLNLGVGLKDSADASSKARAAEYFKKAEECYLSLIERGKQQAEPPKWLTGMKLRLADASRSAGNYETALKTIEEVLREYPEAPNVQSAAAELLEDWGFSDQADSPKRLLEAINGRTFEGQPDPKKNGIKGWMGLTVQYDQMLRPVRARLRELRDAEERIIAYENTLKERAQRADRLEAAKTLAQDDVKDAEDALAVIDDALAATREWLKLKQERDELAAAGKDVERIEQINRLLAHMVDSQYYQKLLSGDLEEEYRKAIAKLEKESEADAEKKIAKYQQLLEEIQLEKGTGGEEGVLAPAFRTGQRIVRAREQLAVLLQKEYDQFALSANTNPGAAAMLEKLKSQIDAVKPASLDKERAKAVEAELEALANERRGRTKEELQQELKILRNAVHAWTAYELVRPDVPGNLSELALDDETLRAKLEAKKADLAQKITDEEAKEADLQARLMEVLHHAVETRHKYAKVQSSNVEKEKALRAAQSDALALTNRIPRKDIGNEWWNKFNATYKEIRRDLKPFAKDGEMIDTTADLPVPEQVAANLTWLERPSNTAVAVIDPDDVSEGNDDDSVVVPPVNMTWVILAVLLALGGTGGVVYLMMGAQKKKPFRVNYGPGPMGGEERPLFPGTSSGEPAPQTAGPLPVKKSVSSTGPRTRSPGATSGDAPRKAAPKKRPPEATGEPPKPRPKPRPPE